MLALSPHRDEWGGVLYQARRMLLGGGAVTLVSRLRAHDDDVDGPNGAVL